MNPLNLNRLEPAEGRSRHCPEPLSASIRREEMFKLTFAAGLLSAGIVMAQNPILTVYAPDYFTSEWGPGPSIEAKFEETCNCDLVFSAGELLPRLVLEGQNTKADVVIGLNTDITKKARELGIFSPHNQDNSRLNLPVEWEDEILSLIHI